MEKILELKHLVPYLPYGLTWYYNGENKDYGDIFLMNNLTRNNKISLVDISNNSFVIDNFDVINFEFQPLLIPLTYIKEDDVFWEEFYKEFGGQMKQKDLFKKSWTKEILFDPMKIDFNRMQLLFKKHYDVFGLIEKGLAKNIIEFKKNKQ